MQQNTPFNKLNFERQPRRIPGRIVVTVITLVGFSIFWRVVPSQLMYWFLFLVLGILTWFASFGWRQAVVTVINFLNSLVS